MSHSAGDTITRFGDPLGFKVRQGDARSPVIVGAGEDTFKVEARIMVRHQKEALLTEGASGSVWRLASDEGAVMNGDDLAPFPLGFFTAGVVADLSNRIRAHALQEGVELEKLQIGMSHAFEAEGSFIQSTATAYSRSCDLSIALGGDLQPEAAKRIAAAALDSSPAIAFLRTPMHENSFALYINGRRRKVIAHQDTIMGDAVDPFLVHTKPARPLDRDDRTDLLAKADAEHGEAVLVSPATTGKRMFTIDAIGEMAGEGRFLTETWIARPGMSHFRFADDESDADTAPSGLGLLSAGIGLCFLTQLSRYIEVLKLDISGARLVQFNPYSTNGAGLADPISTHLFLNGDAPEEVHANLLNIAARTCFMHVAATMALESSVTLSLNGHSID